MGRHEGSKNRRRHQEGLPVEIPGVPRLQISLTIERQYGPLTAMHFRRLDNLLYEYDGYIYNEELSLADVAMYAQEAGVLDECVQVIPKIATTLHAAGKKRFQQAITRGAGQERVNALFHRFHNQVIENRGISDVNRPLFMAMYRDSLFFSRWLDYQAAMKDQRDITGTTTPEYSLLEIEMERSRVPFNEAGVPDFSNVDVLHVNELLLLSSLRDLHDKLKAGHVSESTDEEAERAKAEGDYIANSIKGLPIASGSAFYRTPSDQCMQLISIDQSSDHPETVSGWVQCQVGKEIIFKDLHQKIQLTMPFAISRITGDLVIPNTVTASPEILFEKYGIKKLYYAIRLQLLKAVEDAILTDKLQIRQDKFQTTFTLRAAEVQVAPMAVEDIGVTGLPEAPEVLESVLEPVLTTAVPQPNEVVNHPVEIELDRLRKKAERLRTIKYRKAMSALERLGVTFESGGRHLKARYNGIPAAFPNPHSGKNGDITYILRSVLEILGISEEDFIRAL